MIVPARSRQLCGRMIADGKLLTAPRDRATAFMSAPRGSSQTANWTGLAVLLGFLALGLVAAFL